MTEHRQQIHTMKKIPNNANLVFKGVLHDIYHWPQEMFDGSTATFEAIKKKDAVTAVVIVDNTILINHEEQPYVGSFITLPGGHSEDDDFLKEAKRELLEETGYESEEWVHWFTVDILQSEKIEWNNHFFIAKGAEKTSEQNVDAGEKIETHLYTFDEFLELRHDPQFRNKDLIPVLQKAAENEEEKQKLKNIFGITT